ncbi:DNA-directed RNA polymerase III subunit RPC8 [Balamuthia mandrillaris]
MFVLVLLSDTVKVPPHKFSYELDAIKTELNKKYGDKVIPKVGLGVTLYDVVKVGDGFIYPGDGSAHTKVTFRMVVFRPFRGEVIVGKLRHSTPDGITVSLGFFEDVFIPKEELQEPSFYDKAEKLWVWEYQSETGEQHRFFMDPGFELRFRVTSLQFNETPRKQTFKPKKPDHIMPDANANKNEPSSSSSSSDSHAYPPMAILGTCKEDGLGMLDWW